MRDDPHHPAGPQAPRSLGPALLRGWRRCCPNCGGGPIYDRYLRVRDACAACGEELHHHRADDAPAWATILIAGHLMAPPIILASQLAAIPVWVHSLIWPVAALALVMLLLPRVKGAIVGYQWALRMHGFDGR